jgi:hypothetical protein
MSDIAHIIFGFQVAKRLPTSQTTAGIRFFMNITSARQEAAYFTQVLFDRSGTGF